MKSLRNLWWLGVVAAVAACDPYEDEAGGTPAVLSVFGSGGDADGAAAGAVVDGTNEGGTWMVSTPSVCEPEHLSARGVVPRGKTVDMATTGEIPVVTVKTNKLLDGASIQADPLHCDPAVRDGKPWITVLRTGGADVQADDTAHWFTCYSPSTSTSAEGASIVIYRGEDVTTGFAGDGWFVLSDLVGEAGEFTKYEITGTVFDKQGNPLPIDLNVDVEPDAGAVKSFRATSITGTGDAVAATLEFTPAGCGSASRYQVQKDINTDPKKDPVWVDVGGAITAAGPFTVQDTGLTYGKSYDYRVRTVVVPAGSTDEIIETAATYTLNVLEFPTAAPSVTLLAASGTGTEAKPNRVSIDYTAALPPGADSNAVLRAEEDESIATEDEPGAFSVIFNPVGLAGSSATTKFPVEDTKLSGCKLYFYAVAAVDAEGNVGERGPTASIKSPPAAVAEPTLAPETTGGVKVTWAILRGAVTYQVQRADDVAGAPGAFADIGSPVTQPVDDPADASKPATKESFTDATAVAGTKYHYRVNVATSDPALCSDVIAVSTGAAASITR